MTCKHKFPTEETGWVACLKCGDHSWVDGVKLVKGGMSVSKDYFKIDPDAAKRAKEAVERIFRKNAKPLGCNCNELKVQIGSLQDSINELLSIMKKAGLVNDAD